MVRFMHFSDTHIGNRQYNMQEREQDFMDSFSEAVSIGLNEKVDFFVHSGDLFDVWNPSNRSLTFLRDSMLELKERGINVYMVLGDHDRPKRVDYPAAEIFDFLGITVLGKDGFQGMDLEINGEPLFLGGVSNMKGIRRDMLPDEYKKASSAAEGKKNSVLISHQGVTGFGLKDEACEIRKEEIPGNFSYLAFGHIHESGTSTVGESLFSYAGSSEICSTNEIPSFLKNGKSVNLVSIPDSTFLDSTRSPVTLARLSDRPCFCSVISFRDSLMGSIFLTDSFRTAFSFSSSFTSSPTVLELLVSLSIPMVSIIRFPFISR